MFKRKTKKILVFEIKTWSQTLLNMPVRGEILKNPSLQQFWISKTARSFEINLKRYFCTDFIEVKVKKILWKKNLEIVVNFGNLQSGLESHRICQFVEKYKKIQISKIANFRYLMLIWIDVEKYEKNSRMTNFQIW